MARLSAQSQETAKRLPPKARRAQLLGCAIVAVAAMGIERATHAEVARLAGVSVPTVFVYFPTRDDLVGAALREVAHALDAFAGATLALSDPARRLTSLARAFERAADEIPDVMRVWLDWSTAVRTTIWPRYLKVQDRIVANVATAVRDYRSPREARPSAHDIAVARMFVGSGHTVALSKLAGAPQSDVDRLIEAIVSGTLAAARA
jgi:TetR/AcrR family hemagglutinin/protease transcriptional regulator